MITKNDVINAINERLLVQWPDRTVYVDVCPVDFERPSFWLFTERDNITDANRFWVRRDLRIRLTLHDELDEHYDASWYRLSNEVDKAVALLIPPLKVCGRHLKLNLNTQPRDPDKCVIQINASWLDNRPGLDTETAVPADSYALNIRASIN